MEIKMVKSAVKPVEGYWAARAPEGNIKIETIKKTQLECYLTALRLFDLDRCGWKISKINSLPTKPRQKYRALGKGKTGPKRKPT